MSKSAPEALVGARGEEVGVIPFHFAGIFRDFHPGREHKLFKIEH